MVNIALSLGLFSSYRLQPGGLEADRCSSGRAPAVASYGSLQHCSSELFSSRHLRSFSPRVWPTSGNGVFPTGFTLEHYASAASGSPWATQLVVASLITGLVASLLALLCGSWAALALRACSRGGMEPNLGPPLLHSERRAVGVGGARPPGRLQPAPAAL